MILILEDDADREQYRRVHPLNPEFLNPDTMRPATVWISTEAYEEKVRANEREQYQGRRDDMMRALSEELLHVRTKTLVDLRAKVKAAREQFMRVTRTPADHPMARQYDEFLALIDGSSNE